MNEDKYDERGENPRVILVTGWSGAAEVNLELVPFADTTARLVPLGLLRVPWGPCFLLKFWAYPHSFFGWNPTSIFLGEIQIFSAFWSHENHQAPGAPVPCNASTGANGCWIWGPIFATATARDGMIVRIGVTWGNYPMDPMGPKMVLTTADVWKQDAPTLKVTVDCMFEHLKLFFFWQQMAGHREVGFTLQLARFQPVFITPKYAGSLAQTWLSLGLIVTRETVDSRIPCIFHAFSQQFPSIFPGVQCLHFRGAPAAAENVKAGPRHPTARCCGSGSPRCRSSVHCCCCCCAALPLKLGWKLGTWGQTWLKNHGNTPVLVVVSI